MALVKHNERSVRKGCKRCGQNDGLYWAHDTSITSGEKWCDKCGLAGKWTLVDKDLRPHSEVCAGQASPGVVSYDVPEVHAPESVLSALAMGAVKPETQVEPEVSVPQPPAEGAFAAFQTLMESLGPRVDRAEVEAIVKREVERIVRPTVTVVERVSGVVTAIDGTHAMLGEVCTDLLAGLNVMMVGPAGTGKSTIAENAAEALGVPFYAISCSPQMPVSQLLGYMNATGDYVPSLFRQAYEHGGVFLIDEIDNSHPAVLAVLNQALANGHMAFPDQMVKRHDDFRCVAAANTYGRGADRQYVGRQAMDAATLDRFAVETILVDEALETSLCQGTGLDSHLVDDVLKLVRTLRASAERQNMRVVISPRASIGMCKLLSAGKAWSAAAEAVIYKGMSEQDRKKLES